jgi:hypothetical protein
MASHATFRNLLQLFMRRAALNDQRRIELFQHIPIPLKKHREEFEDVVCHQIQLDPATHSFDLDGFSFGQQSQGFFGRKDMHAAQIVIGIRRWEPVKMRPAYSGEQ